jgi:CheY-like chemotaxis protein
VATIVVIDDDPAMDLLVDSFTYRGHESYRVPSLAEAMQCLDQIVQADIVILDILMPSSGTQNQGMASAPVPSGMALLRELRKAKGEIPVIALSAVQDNTIIEALADDPATSFVSKWDSHPLREMIYLVQERLGIHDVQMPRPFIVHGHAEAEKLALKNYIQNTLHLPEPIILHELPNLGRTVIEKFEDYAAASALVFVLLTPDDVGAPIAALDDAKRRARQNVVFEMGYFLGILGRQTGRVLLLYSGDLELPSDLSGVIYIDISTGVEAAGEKIRKELAHVL